MSQAQGATTGTLNLFSSINQGISWISHAPIATVQNAALFSRLDLAGVPRFGPDTLFTAYTDTGTGPQTDAFLLRSNDAGGNWSNGYQSNTPILADRNAYVRVNGMIVVGTYEGVDPVTSQFTTHVITSGDGGVTFHSQPLANLGTAVSGTALAYDGNRLLVGRTFGSPSDVFVDLAGPLNRFDVIPFGGCGVPGNPSWSVRGNLANGSVAALNVQAASVPVYLGVSGGIKSVPNVIQGCVVALELNGLVGAFAVSNASGEVPVGVPPLPRGFGAYLQGGSFANGSLSTSFVLDVDGYFR
jgi:hypothetical protein